MNMELFNQRKKQIYREYRELIARKNRPMPGNGIFERYVYPVITADHIPIEYRYDLNPETNPYFMERIGVNATMNSGAIYLDGRYLLVVRVEGSIGNPTSLLPRVTTGRTTSVSGIIR